MEANDSQLSHIATSQALATALLPGHSSEQSAYWVPCVPNPLNGTFAPLRTMADYPATSLEPKTGAQCSRGGIKQIPWSEAEDALLTELIRDLGLKRWGRIAAIINAEVYDQKPVRIGKHCRERWHNHLNPELNSKS